MNHEAARTDQNLWKLRVPPSPPPPPSSSSFSIRFFLSWRSLRKAGRDIYAAHCIVRQLAERGIVAQTDARTGGFTSRISTNGS